MDYSDYWQGIIPDTVSSPDSINDGSTAIRSALWFWLTYKSYKTYNTDRGNGLLDVKNVTSKVNGGDVGLEERKAAYKLAERAL